MKEMNSVPFQKLGKPSQKFDILGNLPNEVSYKILKRLTSQDIINVFNCSKKWSRHLNYALFWKSKLRIDYPDFEENRENGFYSKFIRQFSSPWQGRYLYNYGLQVNFENNNVKRISVDHASCGDPDEPFKCVHFDDHRLIFYRKNRKQINVVDSRTGRLEKVFTTNFLNISSAIKHGDLLISISALDHVLKVWNIESEKCLVHKRIGIINRFRNLLNLLRPRLTACKHLIFIRTPIVGCEYFQVHILDLKTKAVKKMIGVINVCCNNDIIAFVKDNRTVQITNVNFDKFTTVDCLTSESHQIMINNNYLVKASREDALVWNIKTKRHFIIPDKRKCKLISDNKLICSDSNTNWELWNLDSQKFEFKIDDSDIVFITWNKSYIFTTCFNDNCVVKIWCIKTGRCLQSFPLLSSNHPNFMATEEKLVFANGSLSHSTKRKKKYSFHILDYQANIQNHLKEM